MARKRYTSEQIIHKLREAEVELAGGKTVPATCRKLGVSEQTFYRWRKWRDADQPGQTAGLAR